MNGFVSAAVFALAMFVSSASHAAGLSYAVSLEKAKEILRTDSSKHLLVFYTEAW